jgi:hypothetical protein
MSRRYADAEFEAFWQSYPKKVGKLAAKREWDRIRPTPELVERMARALAWQKEQWDDPQFIPHPKTWLYQGRWDDEPVVELAPKSMMSEAAASVFRVIGEKAS